MKELTKLFSMLLIVLALGFTSCGSDDKDDDAPSPQISLADKVACTYSGRLSLGETVLEDAYIVTVTKQTANTVSVYAKFFGDNAKNFNLSESNGQIHFSNSTLSNFNMSVTGNAVVINYLSGSGNMLTYVGNK